MQMVITGPGIIRVYHQVMRSIPVFPAHAAVSARLISYGTAPPRWKTNPYTALILTMNNACPNGFAEVGDAFLGTRYGAINSTHQDFNLRKPPLTRK